MYIIISNHHSRVLAIYEQLSFSRSSVKSVSIFVKKIVLEG
ncbi:hypothetical protein B4113_2040 [Geobacillus sp. B4113_201601]|nr:hypothetical protein B4113_2040 [Geobacillus sp. B4113_201601]